MASRAAVLVLALAAGAQAKTFFKEQFNDAGWENRWVASTNWKSAGEMGSWEWTAGEWYGDAEDKGIKTGEDMRFYGLTAMLDEPFTQTGDLIVQYTVKHEQKLDCGGAYIKVGPKADQASFGGDTPYSIMFGPDICGTGTRRTHAIFNYPAKDDNLLIKKDVKCETDQKSHLYTLHVKGDGSYEISIDGKVKQEGALEKDWDFLLPKEIKDPNESKPKDWVDTKKIPDPNEVKPEGYDDIPAKIPDPDASQPDDWEEEEDGEWEPPMIDNPEYKGKWKPTMIDNPEYKGEWVHPMVPNPDYKEDPDLAKRCTDCQLVGFELWQVKAGTLFDDIIITDSKAEADAFAQETFYAKKDAESEMFDDKEQERKDKEKAEREAKKAAKAAAEEKDEEEEHDEL